MNLRIRRAQEKDVVQARTLLEEAYEMWKGMVDPRSFEEGAVRKYLLEDGYVALDESEDLVGLFCLRKVSPRLEGRTVQVLRANRVDTAELFESEQTTLDEKEFGYFYRLGVQPGKMRSGIGAFLMGEIEKISREELGADGILLEVGENSDWVKDWYQRLGFRQIASNTEISTIMMLRSF